MPSTTVARSRGVLRGQITRRTYSWSSSRTSDQPPARHRVGEGIGEPGLGVWARLSHTSRRRGHGAAQERRDIRLIQERNHPNLEQRISCTAKKARRKGKSGGTTTLSTLAAPFEPAGVKVATDWGNFFLTDSIRRTRLFVHTRLLQAEAFSLVDR